MKTIVDTTNIYVEGKKVYPDVPLIDLQDVGFVVHVLNKQEQAAKIIKDYINANHVMNVLAQLQSNGLTENDLVACPVIDLVNVPIREDHMASWFIFGGNKQMIEFPNIYPLREYNRQTPAYNGFNECNNLEGTITCEYQIGTAYGSQHYDMMLGGFFGACRKLEHVVNFDVSQLPKNANLNDDKTSVYTNVRLVNPCGMFDGCYKIKTIDIKFPNFYYRYDQAFNECRELTNQQDITIDMTNIPSWVNEDNDDWVDRENKKCNLERVFNENHKATKFPTITGQSNIMKFICGFNNYGNESGVIAQEDFHLSYAEGANIHRVFDNCYILKDLYIDTTNEPDANDDGAWRFIPFNDIGCSQIGTDNDNNPIYGWDGWNAYWDQNAKNKATWLNFLKVHFQSQELKEKFLAKFETDTTSAKYGALDKMFVVD